MFYFFLHYQNNHPLHFWDHPSVNDSSIKLYIQLSFNDSPSPCIFEITTQLTIVQPNFVYNYFLMTASKPLLRILNE